MSTSPTVSPHPTVAISIEGDEITVNGETVEHDGTAPLHQVAIHAVAQRVARPLNRAVRAVATDHTGRTALVVHPDGHATDLAPLPSTGKEGQIDPDAQSVETALSESTTEAGTAGRDPEVVSADTADVERMFAVPAAPTLVSVGAKVAPKTIASITETNSIGAAAQAGELAVVEPEPVKVVGPDTRATHRAVRENRSFLTVHEDIAAAQHGWRGILARFGYNAEPSAAEKAERADVRATSRHWPGPRTIAIVNGKGGAGKTPATVILSSLFARHGGSGVLAWDNNETRGTLGWRTEQGPHEAHVLDLLPRADALMQPTARAADLAAYVHHQVDDKYDVLRSNPLLLPHQQRLTAADFDAVHQVAAKYFRLIFCDSGNDETAPHWLQMISHADQLVVATTTRPDHAEAGRLLLDALRDRDEHARGLADGAVVIVSQADRDREEASAATIAAGYEGLARQALTIPYDRAMRAPWLRYNALQPATRRAYLAAAAAVSEGL